MVRSMDSDRLVRIIGVIKTRPFQSETVGNRPEYQVDFRETLQKTMVLLYVTVLWAFPFPFTKAGLN